MKAASYVVLDSYIIYDKSVAIQSRLEVLLDRARYHGEHTAAIKVFEDLKTEVDELVGVQEEY